jgi:nucleotidyltransferase substrate binding protein (TIGR01987 family)
MNKEKLDISALTKAIDCLQEGLARYQLDTTDTQIRDGLIKRFEFTYEISHKTLKRHLEAISATPEQYDQMQIQGLIRSGKEQALLLGDWLVWKSYRDMRSKTSHTYDEEVALEVVAQIPAFLKEAIYCRDQLRQRLQ